MYLQYYSVHIGNIYLLTYLLCVICLYMVGIRATIGKLPIHNNNFYFTFNFFYNIIVF